MRHLNSPLLGHNSTYILDSESDYLGKMMIADSVSKVDSLVYMYAIGFGDPFYLLFLISGFETVLYCSLIAFVLVWDWYFGLPFAFTQIIASGAFRLDGRFGLGPVVGTLLAWVITALFLLVFAASDLPHVNLLLMVFIAHSAVTSFFGVPSNASWWFANTLGWLAASILAGCVRLAFAADPGRTPWEANAQRRSGRWKGLGI
jgi:hypothetical protein